jgi:hypothetical protein
MVDAGQQAEQLSGYGQFAAFLRNSGYGHLAAAA